MTRVHIVSVPLLMLMFVLLLLPLPLVGKQCEYRDRCSCVFDDGSGMVDVSSIGYKDGMPVFFDYTAAVDPYMYSYNPCYAFTEGTCSNAAVCQYDYRASLTYVTVGDADKVTYNMEGSDVIIQYTSVDGSRNSYVKCKCDPQYTTAFMAVIGESSTMKYDLNMEAKACCPVPAPPDWKPKGSRGDGISTGSVLLIIFFALLTVYVVGGGAYLKFKHQATGVEMIPNLSFWTGLPATIKAGAAYAMGLVCRKRSVYTSGI